MDTVTAQPRRPVVDARGLSHDWGDGRPVLQSLELRVQAGEFVAIVGPSGCGKTTLLQLLGGLLPAPPSLQVLGAPPGAGRTEVVYLPAQDCLLPWRSALDNAAFGMELRGVPRHQRLERAREMLHRVGLAAFEGSHPAALSQGMRQRVALARSFCIVSPESLLLMDEPFAALDVLTRMQLGSLLLALRADAGASVVFVTHDLQEAIGLADRVVVLSQRPARVLADMPVPWPRPRSLVALYGDADFHALYRRLWATFGATQVPA